MSTTEEERTSSKYFPKWDGTKAAWPRFKVEMEGAIAGVSKYSAYVIALREDKFKILKSEEQSSQKDKEQQDMEYKIRRYDVELYKILISAIPNEGQGKKVYQLISKCKNKEYKDGSFKSAWTKLNKLNERTSTQTLRNLTSKYAALTMGEEEEPFDFLMKLSELRTLMEKHGKEITEEDYLQDTMDRLPKNYRSKKLELKTMIEKKEVTNEDDMLLELLTEYGDLFPEKIDDGTNLQDDDEKIESALVGQFKGRCNKCGEYGHMARDCPEKKTNGIVMT